VIGQGSYGKILLTKHTESEQVTKNFFSRLITCGFQIYAIKVVLKEKMIMVSNPEHILNEKNCLEKVHSDFIVRLHWAFQDEHHLYLVMDYVGGGDLFSVLEQERRLNEETARFYASEILLALRHMHSLNIVYRDLKPENVLIGLDGHIVLADLGFAKNLEKEQRFRSSSICGTSEYIAPEIVFGTDHSFECDLWCFGVVLYEMLVGKTPYHSRDMSGYLDRLSKHEPVHFPPYISSAAQDLITRLLQFKPEERIGAASSDEFGSIPANSLGEIMGHPFFESVDFEAIAQKLQKPPYLPAKDQFEVASDTLTGAKSKLNLHDRDLQEVFSKFKTYARNSSNVGFPEEKDVSLSWLNLNLNTSSDSPAGTPRIRVAQLSPSLTPNIRKNALLSMTEIFDFKNENLDK
jgi:serine/threonine protein kinase